MVATSGIYSQRIIQYSDKVRQSIRFFATFMLTFILSAALARSALLALAAWLA